MLIKVGHIWKIKRKRENILKEINGLNLKTYLTFPLDHNYTQPITRSMLLKARCKSPNWQLSLQGFWQTDYGRIVR